MGNKKRCPVCDYYLEENSDICENCGTIISYFNNEGEKSDYTTTKLQSEEVFSFLTKRESKNRDAEEVSLAQMSLPLGEELPKRTKNRFKHRVIGWIFDIFLVSTIWFLTQIFTSIILKTNVFNLISSSYIQLIIFFLILLFIYLFLFILFFKQTLGEFLLKIFK